MASSQAQAGSGSYSASLIKYRASLRFSFGTTGAFALCEAMQWHPTFLAPLLAAVLITSMPTQPSVQACITLVLIQAVAAYSAYGLTAVLHETPSILFGVIGLILLIAFANLALGRAFLPLLLVLIAFATIPIVTMVDPQQALPLPFAFVRSMAVAVLATWVVHGIWPNEAKAGPAAAPAGFANPVRLALAGIAIVLPLMLLFLLYSITDALPILITTIVLIINFDPKKSSAQGLAMVIANFLGGMVALFAYYSIQAVPNLLMLMLTVFLIAAVMGEQISRGGPKAALGVITFNQTMVLLSLALNSDSSIGIWSTRLFQFVLAGFFAVGMMTLLFRPSRP